MARRRCGRQWKADSANKAYVVNFGRALVEELRPFGIRMMTLCPGGTRTEFMEVAGQHVGDVAAIRDPDADAVARIGLESRAAGCVAMIPGMIDKLSIGSLCLVAERMIADDGLDDGEAGPGFFCCFSVTLCMQDRGSDRGVATT